MSTNDASSPNTNRQLLSDRLREAREYVGLTQDDVARKLGIPRSALSLMESGARKVEALELTQLAKLYQRDLNWFTGEKLRAARVSKDVAYLARAAEELSPKDRAELAQFADFLKSRARSKADPNE
jgi:transcriptional regulator with XRE-family HTH domain